jgi:hypothetical protein
MCELRLSAYTKMTMNCRHTQRTVMRLDIIAGLRHEKSRFSLAPNPVWQLPPSYWLLSVQTLRQIYKKMRVELKQ